MRCETDEGRRELRREQVAAHLQDRLVQGRYLGRHDMHGNVWEWCNDRYGGNCYDDSPREDPQGPDEDAVRGLRGGSWLSDGGHCRSAIRLSTHPTSRNRHLG